ncbi:Uncharacterised protein [Neisseria meningitidis]|nr:Uncharacterised protein [Neisseria meningitidis]
MNQCFEAFECGFVRLSDLAQGRGNPFAGAGQFLQVERTACFGACAGQTVSAEGLYADDCADDVAVDVNVAGFDAAADVAYRAFDAAVYAVGQGVAFAVDLVDDVVEFVGAVADDVQDGTEDFALQFVEVVQFKQDGANERGFFGIDIGGGFDFVVGLGNTFHFVDVVQQVLLCFGIDDGADIGSELNRFADDEFVHSAFDHVEHTVGNVFLDAQNAQGGAALSRAVEGGVQYVGADLLGKCGGIDNHGVLSAGFGNQDGIVAAFGKGFVDQARHFGRAGENHAADAGIVGQCRTHVACAEDELQGGSRDAGFVHEGNGITGNQAGLFGGFGDDGVACRQCGNDFAGKDGEREVPRADGDNRADGFCVLRQGMFGFVCVVAAEIDGFAHFGNGVVQRFACFAHGKHHQCWGVLLQQIGKTAQAGGAFGGRCRTPFGERGNGCANRFLGKRGIGKADCADDVVVVGRVFNRLRFADIAGFAVDDGCGVEVLRGGFVHLFLKLLQYVFVAQVHALRVQTAFAVQIARQRQGVVQVDALFGDGVERAADERVDADVFIDDLVDERRVRAVFQQAAHQVGEQGFVCADWGVHAHAAA